MRRAYSYLRFSEPRQQWGDSERRQAKATETYCSSHKLLLDESLDLRDRGKSGFHGDNLGPTGKLAAFLDAVQRGRVSKGSVLIVENLDRLTRRQTLKAVNLFTSILEAGMSIVTLKPEREYTYESVCENVVELIEVVMNLYLGYEESRKKSERVLDEWRERLTKIHKEKATARCPGWLELRPDRKVFIEKPDAARVVRRIFKWAVEGLGVHCITRRLNEAMTPHFGGRGSTTWHESYVRKILTSRAVLGEYQSYTGKGRSAKPYGNPVVNYFPRIISESRFYAVQAALKSRKTQMGPTGDGVANLFTGLMRDARDGSTLTMTQKSKGSYDPRKGKWGLVSSKAARGVPGSVYISFPYKLVEEAILSFLHEVRLSDILPTEGQNERDEEIAGLNGRVLDLDHKIMQARKKIDQQPDIDVLLDLLADLDRQKKEAVSALEKLKEEAAGNTPEAVDEVRSLVRLLRKTEGQEQGMLRSRLKAKIRLLISEIWTVFTEMEYIGSRGRTFRGRAACVQLFFENGTARTIRVNTWDRLACGFSEVSEFADLRKDYRWFEQEARGS